MPINIERVAVERQAKIEEEALSRRLQLDARAADLLRAAMDPYAQDNPIKAVFVVKTFYVNRFVVKMVGRSQLRPMSEDFKKMLAVTIKAARQRMQLTQEELASRIGRTSESVSNLERGLHLPSIDTLADLARELGVPISEFFEAPGLRKIAPERAKLEARLREIGRTLDDRDLRLAVRLLSVAIEASLAD